ncbi:MAG TPA: hypothetical protein VIT23_09235 [Terrimicrobiaceae bacterium]
MFWLSRTIITSLIQYGERLEAAHADAEGIGHHFNAQTLSAFE